MHGPGSGLVVGQYWGEAMVTGFKVRSCLLCGSAMAALAGLGLAPAAFAQAPPAPAAAPETTVPEVVVTAERRVENLQQTAISATVLDARQLQSQGVYRTADLQRISPSLSITTYNRSTFINIRGIGIAQSAPTSTPGVAYYIDGAFIPHETYIGNTFYDLESVEVLRGPQGTLTGQNSTGGAIYARSAAPRLNQFSVYADQTVGDYSWFRTVAAVNVPIADKAALRVAGVHETRDSFTNNVGGGNRVGNVDFDSIRASLEVRPADNLTVDVRYEGDRNLNNGNAYKNRRDANPDPFVVEEDAMGYFNQRMDRADVELKYTFIPQLQLRYLYSNQNGRVVDLVDGDRGLYPTTQPAPNNGRLGYTSTLNRINIHELDLISQDSGPLQYVFGGFLLDETVPVSLKTYGRDTATIQNAPTSDTETSAVNASRSVFGQITYRFSPQWQVVAGGRESWDSQTYKRLSGLPGAPYTTKATSAQPTGRVALNYNFKENVLVYASVSRGYKAGGVNLLLGTGNFLPETNTVEEIGVKTDLFDHHLRFDADGFVSQYENLQLSSLTANRLPFTENLSRSSSDGFEAEVTGRFDALQFNGGVAYVDARTNTGAALTDNSVTPSVLSFVPSGSRLPFAPEWTLNGGLQYDLRLGEGRLTPRIQWNYVSTSYALLFENARTVVPAHDTWDLRVTYAPAADFSIEGFVLNLADKRYIAAQVQDSSSANGGIIYGNPRQFGVRLVYRYH